MKSYIFILFSLLYGSLAAQHIDSVDTMPHHKHHRFEHNIYVNTTFFLKQVISLSNANLEISPYIVGYQFFPSPHHGIRFSVGGSYTNHFENPDSTFVRINKGYDVSYRVGYQYRKQMGKTWTFLTGMDIVNGFSGTTTKVNSADDIVTTSSETFTLGGGPMVGIQMNVSKRISLFTETAFYYTYASTRTKVSSVNLPLLNISKVADTQQTGKFLLPTSIFFIFRF
jgi:hypothetical protein